MKKLTFFGKILFWINSVAALLLLISFVLPFVPPKSFPALSLLSLTVSPLLLLNFLFCLYWLVQLKKQFLLSAVMLVLAYFFFNPFVEFSSEKDISAYDKKISVLSYNVRLFNAYETNSRFDDVEKSFKKIIEAHNPDIICLQEYYKDTPFSLLKYPYQFIHFKNEKLKMGQAIFSKYPLINTGAFNFEKTQNNTLYADIVRNNDTIRLYNMHLKSMSIMPTVQSLQEEEKQKLYKRLKNAFIKQQEQVLTIISHKKQTSYLTLFAGDFNNTSFSYIYRELQQNMKDAFVENGNGLGTTFRFDSYPMRIDYIFTSPHFDVLSFDTLEETFSDHYPIYALLGW